jgi:hypothetical protein
MIEPFEDDLGGIPAQGYDERLGPIQDLFGSGRTHGIHQPGSQARRKSSLNEPCMNAASELLSLLGSPLCLGRSRGIGKEEESITLFLLIPLPRDAIDLNGEGGDNDLPEGKAVLVGP